jgi:negative regulator of genetic competence, sporulation and motility
MADTTISLNQKQVNHSLLSEQVRAVHKDVAITIHENQIILHDIELTPTQITAVETLIANHDETQKSASQIKLETNMVKKSDAKENAKTATTDAEKIAVLWDFFTQELGL